jgi:bifunctional non-homologous end joining protein LigD
MVVEPMMAVAAPLPTRDEQDFGAEWKWDVVRAAAYVQKGALRLVSRNLQNITPSYPDLADLGALLTGRQVVLDGEIVAFNEAGRPDFGTLQARMLLCTCQPRPARFRSGPVG